MSRIGKAPITIPSGVTVEVKGGEVSVKGPKGQLKTNIRPELSVTQADGKIIVARNNEDRLARSLHGLSRTLVANMVKGVTVGFEDNWKLSASVTEQPWKERSWFCNLVTHTR